MATIKKKTLKNGRDSYEVRLQLKDSPCIRRRFPTKERAHRFALETELAIREGRCLAGGAEKSHTVAEAINRYKDNVLPGKRPGTQDADGPRLLWWRDCLGCVGIKAVSIEALSDARDALTKAGKSSATVRRYFAVLRHVFNVAKDQWGWDIDKNPVATVSLPKEPAGRERLLTNDEWVRLFCSVRESETKLLAPLLELLLLTGCRLNEILGLSWHEIRWEERRILIPASRNKSKRPAFIPLGDSAIQILSELRDCQKAAGIITPCCFPSKKSLSKPVHSVKTAWRNALVSAGIADFRIHDVRHAAASQLAANGGTIAELRILLRHKDYAILDRYTHTTPEVMNGVSSKLENAVGRFRKVGGK